MSRQVFKYLLRLGGFFLVSGFFACTTSQIPSPIAPLVATPDEEFRTQPPPPLQKVPFTVPHIQVSKLENSMSVMTSERKGTGVVSIVFSTRLGGETYSSPQPGLSYFVGQVLTQSTEGEFAELSHMLERRGLSPTVSVHRDGARLSVVASSERLPEVIPILAQIVRRPSFAQKRIDAVRKVMTRRVKSAWSTPEARAYFRAKQILYGEDHPRSRPIWGSIEDIRSFSREHVAKRYSKTWIPFQSALIVVGDIEPSEVERLAFQSFGDWSGPERSVPSHRGTDQFSSPSIRLLRIKSSARRAQILLLDRAPSRLSQESIPFGILTNTIGGMFSTKLNLKLREEHGYSYGVHADYSGDMDGGEFTFVTNVAQRKVPFALESIVNELDRFRNQGPTTEEVEAGRNSLYSEFTRSLENSRSASMAIASAFEMGLSPNSFMVQLEEQIRTTSRDQVHRSAKRWIRPNKAPFVVTSKILDVLLLNRSGFGPVGIEPR